MCAKSSNVKYMCKINSIIIFKIVDRGPVNNPSTHIFYITALSTHVLYITVPNTHILYITAPSTHILYITVPNTHKETLSFAENTASEN
jgi:hypothetical protein